MSAEKSPVNNEVVGEKFEKLSQETQDRIRELCDKAGMDCVSLETLKKVLRDLNATEISSILHGQHHAATLQNTRSEIDKL